MKTMLALLLIAGIVLAAHADAAFGNESAMRANAGQQDWWQKNFGQVLAARSFTDVPWLGHLTGVKARGDTPLWPQLDTLKPFGLHFAGTPTQGTASGQFQTE